MENGRSCAVVGATGLIGDLVVKAALQHDAYTRVIAWARRPLDYTSPKLKSEAIDFERLRETCGPNHIDDVYLCLGTTLAKSGPNGYQKVDYEYTLRAAVQAQTCGATRAVLVSSIGADSNGSTPYLRTKAKTENAMMDLGFHSLDILRPSVILGNRKESRTMEWLAGRIGVIFSPMMGGKMKKWRPIKAEVIANAMVRYALQGQPGIRIHQSDAIAGDGQQQA